MRRIRTAAAGLVFVGGALVSGAVTAAPASAATCTWVTNDSAQVRENPSINSVVRKTVPAGYVVNGGRDFCAPVTGTDGRSWHEVYCGCATDGFGYIIAYKLNPTVPA